MFPSRSWFKPSFIWTIVIALAVWACGDSGGTTAPTSEKKPVASVTVSPLTADIDIDRTQQFTAILRDASGNTLAGRTVTWSSSSQTVATVSQSGLVTGSGVGEATITATSEGRSGSATATVTQSLPPGVLAVGTVGAAGGSLETPDVGVSIAAGQLAELTQIQILSSSDPMEEFGSDLATGVFRLQGFPQDREVEVRVRLRITAPLREQTFIGMGVPVAESSLDTDEDQPGLVLREATDSAGYLVATLPVRGQGLQAEPGPFQMASAASTNALLDGLLGGVTGARSDSVPGGKFVIMSYGAPRSELTPMVSRITKLMEDSRVTLEGMKYSTEHRSVWPIQVRVHPMRSGANGSFARRTPWPLDVNTGYFNFNTTTFAKPTIPGTAIHEYYHFLQARYTDGLPRNQEYSYKWVKEGASSWIPEKAPETISGLTNTKYQGWRNGFFRGLHPGLTAREGYGKAPLFKYVADRWGDDQVKLIWDNVKAGKVAVDAVLQAIPEAPATWWPDLLTKYMKGEIYSLDPDSLPHLRAETPVDPGFSSWTLPTTLRPFGAEFVHFTPKPDGYGTGTTLTVRLPSGLQTEGFRILPFRKDASGKWEDLGGVADSLVIKGADLNLGREYGLFLILPTASAPYTQSWSTAYETDMGYMDGDWYVADVEVVNDAITYTRPSEADTATIDVAGETPLIFTLLANGGVWKRTPANLSRFVWEPTAEFAADLVEAGATASSEAEVISADSLSLKAVFDLAPPASPVGDSGNPAALGGACLLLLAGLAMRRRRQIVFVAFAGAFGLALWGCDLGSISFSVKYRYDFKFANPGLTASLEDPTVPLVQFENGTGTVFVDRYRFEYWQYTRDEQDAIVDSVAVTRTASGQATVKLGSMLIRDGALDEDDVESLLRARAAGLLKVPVDALPEALRARIRR